MGIYDFYFKWLRASNFVNIFRQNFPNLVSSLSVDGNSIIHECAQLVYGYGDLWKNKYGKEKGEFLKLKRLETIANMTDIELDTELHISVGNKILEIAAAVRPVEYFFFAIDGTIPQAKIVQQRSRRYKNTKKDDSNELEVNPLITVNTTIRFDSTCITPGTDFMVRLDLYLTKFFKENINQLSRRVYYSPHTIKGEGEHKIMDYFRQKKITGDAYHVVYGMDTDLILLTLGLNVSNMVLWRDDIKDKLYIDEFKFQLSQRMGNSPSAVDDFILIMNMAGNDFLPAVPALEDFEVSLNIIIDLYSALFKQYNLKYTTRSPTRVDINWESFVYFLLNLKEHESYLMNFKLQKEYLKSDSLKYATTEQNETGETITTSFNYDNFRNYWYYNEFSPKGNVQIITKFIKPESLDVKLEDINNMAINYLNGINWIAEYYFNGWKGVNLKWYYKHYHSPLFSDIYNNLALLIENNTNLSSWKAQESNVFLNVFEQLLSVLPPSAKDLLPSELRHLMNSDSPLADYYPIDFVVDYELKDKKYKGIPILPFVNPERIHKVYQDYGHFGKERDEYMRYYLNNNDRGWVRAELQDKIICDAQSFKTQLNSAPRGRGNNRGSNRGRGNDRGNNRGNSRGRERDNSLSNQTQIQSVQQSRNTGSINIPTVNFKL